MTTGSKHKRLWRRGWLVALSFVACFVLVACGSFGDDDEDDPTATSETIAQPTDEITVEETARVTETESAGLSVSTPVMPPAEIEGTPELASAEASGCWAIEPSMEQGFPQWSEAPKQVIDASKSYTATFVTTAGNMVFELDPAAAPTTVNSFVCLASSAYYDFTLFHRIMSGFMIQGGDPTGTGTGGPGYQFNDELPEGGTPYTRGTLAMANSGPNTNGSQFFIVHANQGEGFPSSYSVFGHIIEGEDVLDALATMPVTTDARGEPSKPIRTTGILDITIQEDGEPFQP